MRPQLLLVFQQVQRSSAGSRRDIEASEGDRGVSEEQLSLHDGMLHPYSRTPSSRSLNFLSLVHHLLTTLSMTQFAAQCFTSLQKPLHLLCRGKVHPGSSFYTYLNVAYTITDSEFLGITNRKSSSPHL